MLGSFGGIVCVCECVPCVYMQQCLEAADAHLQWLPGCHGS